MKKFLSVCVASLVIGTAGVQAATVRDNCGCGLGGMILGDMNNSLVLQLAATVLNGICGNQTFGITSGTLGCEPMNGFAMKKEMEEYVSRNMDRIAKDMAMGSGASLETLADLLEVQVEARPALFAELQGSFDSVFSSENVSASEVSDAITAIARG